MKNKSKEKYNKQESFEDFKIGQPVKYKGKIWTVVDLFPCRNYVGLEYDPYDNDNEDQDYDLFRDYWKDILNNEEE